MEAGQLQADRALRHLGVRDLPDGVVRFRLEDVGKVKQVIVIKRNDRRFYLPETLLDTLTLTCETLHSGS